MKWHLAAAVVVAGAGAACGQQSPGYPQYGGPSGSNPYSFGPTNPYNRTSQPLSPYLNLLRGGDPGVNYFYGVRPGTTGGAGFGGGAPFMAPGARAGTPLMVQPPDEGAALPGPISKDYVLPPPGHPTYFNNTLGYFPGMGNRGALRPGGQQTGGGRPQTGARR